MNGDQSQSSILNAFVGLIIVLAIIVGGMYFYNNNYTSISQLSQDDTMQNGIPNTGSMATSSMTLMSSVFQPGAVIPPSYTCDGTNTSPPLSWSGVPSDSQSLALLMDDPDVPTQLRPDGVFDHWVMFNIPATTTMVAAGSSVGVAGANGAGRNAYTGPCPPSEYEPSEHRYFFRLYALDTMLSLKVGATKADVLSAMQGHILQEAELMGKYKRQ